MPSGLVFLRNIAFRSFPVAPETRKENASRNMSRRACPLQRLTEEQASPATQPNEMDLAANTAAQAVGSTTDAGKIVTAARYQCEGSSVDHARGSMMLLRGNWRSRCSHLHHPHKLNGEV